MNEAQRKAVRDIGFQSLLHFQIEMIPSRLALNVIDSFDDPTMMLKLQAGDLKITKQTIHDMLGLPMGDLPISALKRADGTNATVKEWRSQFPQSKRGIHTSDVVKIMLEQKDGGRMFKINFLVLVVNCLCKAMKDGTTNRNFLHCITDEGLIKTMDWCGFLLECLKVSKKEWVRNDTKSYYCGPLTFLTLLYVDYIKCEDVDVERSRPAIKNWTTNLLKTRAKSEKDNNSFGTGELLPSISNEEKNDEDKVGQEQNELTDREDDFVVGLGSNGCEDEEKEKTKEVIVGQVGECMMKAKRAMEKMFKLLEEGLTSFPDDEDFKSLKDESELLFMMHCAKCQKNAQTETEVVATEAEVATDFKEAVIDHQETSEQHFQSPENARFESPEKAKDSGEDSLDKLLQKSEAMYITPSLLQAIDMASQVEGQQQDPMSFLDEGQEKVDVNVDAAKSIPVMKLKRDVSMTEVFKSPYMDRAVGLKKKITQKELNVAQSLFSMRKPATDIIFQTSESCYTYRNMLESLVKGQQVFSMVVNCFADVLNYDERYRSPSSPFRLFLNTDVVPPSILDETISLAERQTAFDETIHGVCKKISISPLVFFPILRGSHFYLFVINIKYPAFEILDNSNEGYGIWIKYGNLPKTVLDFFCNYLDEVEHPKAKRLLEVEKEIVRLEIHWRTKHNIIDCGIFAMRHMETYFGNQLKDWHTEFKKENAKGGAQQKQLNELRKMYVSKIFLSDVNQRKNQMLEEVKECEGYSEEEKKKHQKTEEELKIRFSQ